MIGGRDPDRRIAEELRLRSDPPPVVRVSKGALMLAAGVALAGLASLVAWTMADHPRSVAASPEPAPVAPAPPQAVTGLPKDYASLPPGVPKLGPPLPGDLGRPILDGRSAAGASEIGRTGPSEATSRRSAATALEQARSSQLVVATAPLNRETSSALPGGSSPVPSGPVVPIAWPKAPAGAIIRAALITGIRSDLPGPVTAMVTDDLLGGPEGGDPIIPKGSRLIGAYERSVGFGQSRIQVTWNRLLLPDGRSIALNHETAADPQGFAGLEGGVDRHWRRLFAASLVSTFLGVGSELEAGGGDSEVLRAVRTGVAASANQVGQQLVGKSLEVQPTLTIPPGFAFLVILANDLVLQPERP